MAALQACQYLMLGRHEQQGERCAVASTSEWKLASALKAIASVHNEMSTRLESVPEMPKQIDASAKLQTKKAQRSKI